MNSFNDERNGRSVLSNLVPNSIKEKFHTRNGLAYVPSSPSTSSINLNEQDKSSSNNPIVNLKDLIESYAHRLFKENEREYYKAIGKQCNWRDLGKEINWNNFRVKHCETKYQDMDIPGQAKSHVLFRSTYVNDTDRQQEYQLVAERKTMSTCSFELFEGFVNEAEAELTIKIPIPGCASEAGAGFRHEYTMETCRTKTVQEEMNWSVQSTIKVSVTC